MRKIMVEQYDKNIKQKGTQSNLSFFLNLMGFVKIGGIT